MHRLFAIAAVSATAAFLALALAGVPFSNIAWIVPVTTSASIALWLGTMLVAETTYRPRLDAAAMMEGVCPECRTFNSLQEVTSADPNHRYVDCMACKEHIRVTHHGDHFIAERLGKTVD